MPSKTYPSGVVEVHVYRAQIGFRYNARGEDGRIIYEAKRSFRSRHDLQREVRKRWPGVRIVW